MEKIQILEPRNWKDYELLDSGNGEKLERFGKYILRRPEPQAIWQKQMSENEWSDKAMATFKREKSAAKEGEKGEWFLKKGMPGQWNIQYHAMDFQITMRMGLTSFKHVGIFPEQAENWDYIYKTIRGLSEEKPRVLNLFAYTGGASIVAKAAGADVTHVDSVKQVINWSAENMELSGLKDIRWIVDDAMKYVKREVKRGKTYHGIILDPPAYGRGPEGEKWILEEQLDELIQNCSMLLEKKDAFLVLNLYSMGFSAIIADNMLRIHFPQAKNIETGELYLSDPFQKKLPLGIFSRFRI
jgi:23S rRNA (cytosine1962-C5)-methyltransferase